jgi:hypothetical protein
VALASAALAHVECCRDNGKGAYDSRPRMSSHPAEPVEFFIGAKVRSPVRLQFDEDLFLKVHGVEVFAKDGLNRW